METKENLTGSILYASESLDGSFFENAIILVAVHDENGAFGLMINRPSHMPLHEVFNPVPDIKGIPHPFYIGGPVDEEGLHLIHIAGDFDSRNGLVVASGVELGGEWDSIEDVLLSDPHKTLLFLGYSGWNAGQLEDEIAEESWTVYRPNVLSVLEQREQWIRFDRNQLSQMLLES